MEPTSEDLVEAAWNAALAAAMNGEDVAEAVIAAADKEMGSW